MTWNSRTWLTQPVVEEVNLPIECFFWTSTIRPTLSSISSITSPDRPCFDLTLSLVEAANKSNTSPEIGRILVKVYLMHFISVRSVALVAPLLLLTTMTVACNSQRDGEVADTGSFVKRNVNTNGDSSTDGASVRDHFPLTPAEMLDQTTLQEKVLVDRMIDSTVHPGTKMRHLRVSFFSHQWKDGPWRATVELLIPEKLDATREGVVVFAPLGSIHVAKGVDLKRDIFDRTVSELGIPIASIPKMGKHYGHEEIHDMSDHLTLKHLKTGDPSWMPIYPTAAVRARAATLIAKLTKKPVTHIIHMGSSISANHAWLWPLHDARVAALVATGDIGFYRDWFPSDGTVKSSRPAFVAMSKASVALQEQSISLADPYAFGQEFKVKLLQIAGSNDFASPPLSVPKFLDALAGPTHLAVVPNYGHGCASARHPQLLRMWIDHVVDERPLSQVSVKAFKTSDSQLQVLATVSGKAQIKAVNLVYTTTSEPNFLLPVIATGSSKKKYTKATWKEAPMKLEGGSWYASVDLDHAPFVAAYVDVQDEHDGRQGYVSSGIEWLAVE